MCNVCVCVSGNPVEKAAWSSWKTGWTRWVSSTAVSMTTRRWRIVIRCSVAKSCPAFCNPPCPSLSPGVCSNACLSSLWHCLTLSSSAAPFSFCLPSFPASGSFPKSWPLASGSQSIGASASATVISAYIQRRSRGLLERFFRGQPQRPWNCAFLLSLDLGTGSAFQLEFPLTPIPYCPQPFLRMLKGWTFAIYHLWVSGVLLTRLPAWGVTCTLLLWMPHYPWFILRGVWDTYREMLGGCGPTEVIIATIYHGLYGPGTLYTCSQRSFRGAPDSWKCKFGSNSGMIESPPLAWELLTYRFLLLYVSLCVGSWVCGPVCFPGGRSPTLQWFRGFPEGLWVRQGACYICSLYQRQGLSSWPCRPLAFSKGTWWPSHLSKAPRSVGLPLLRPPPKNRPVLFP